MANVLGFQYFQYYRTTSEPRSKKYLSLAKINYIAYQSFYLLFNKWLKGREKYWSIFEVFLYRKGQKSSTLLFLLWQAKEWKLTSLLRPLLSFVLFLDNNIPGTSYYSNRNIAPFKGIFQNIISWKRGKTRRFVGFCSIFSDKMLLCYKSSAKKMQWQADNGLLMDNECWTINGVHL